MFGGTILILYFLHLYSSAVHGAEGILPIGEKFQKRHDLPQITTFILGRQSVRDVGGTKIGFLEEVTLNTHANTNEQPGLQGKLNHVFLKPITALITTKFDSKTKDTEQIPNGTSDKVSAISKGKLNLDGSNDYDKITQIDRKRVYDILTQAAQGTDNRLYESVEDNNDAIKVEIGNSIPQFNSQSSRRKFYGTLKKDNLNTVQKVRGSEDNETLAYKIELGNVIAQNHSPFTKRKVNANLKRVSGNTDRKVQNSVVMTNSHKGGISSTLTKFDRQSSRKKIQANLSNNEDINSNLDTKLSDGNGYAINENSRVIKNLNPPSYVRENALRFGFEEIRQKNATLKNKLPNDSKCKKIKISNEEEYKNVYLKPNLYSDRNGKAVNTKQRVIKNLSSPSDVREYTLRFEEIRQKNANLKNNLLHDSKAKKIKISNEEKYKNLYLKPNLYPGQQSVKKFENVSMLDLNIKESNLSKKEDINSKLDTKPSDRNGDAVNTKLRVVKNLSSPSDVREYILRFEKIRQKNASLKHNLPHDSKSKKIKISNEEEYKNVYLKPNLYLGQQSVKKIKNISVLNSNINESNLSKKGGINSNLDAKPFDGNDDAVNEKSRLIKNLSSPSDVREPALRFGFEDIRQKNASLENDLPHDSKSKKLKISNKKEYKNVYLKPNLYPGQQSVKKFENVSVLNLNINESNLSKKEDINSFLDTKPFDRNDDAVNKKLRVINNLNSLSDIREPALRFGFEEIEQKNANLNDNLPHDSKSKKIKISNEEDDKNVYLKPNLYSGQQSVKKFENVSMLNLNIKESNLSKKKDINTILDTKPSDGNSDAVNKKLRVIKNLSSPSDVREYALIFEEIRQKNASLKNNLPHNSKSKKIKISNEEDYKNLDLKPNLNSGQQSVKKYEKLSMFDLKIKESNLSKVEDMNLNLVTKSSDGNGDVMNEKLRVTKNLNSSPDVKEPVLSIGFEEIMQKNVSLKNKLPHDSYAKTSSNIMASENSKKLIDLKESSPHAIGHDETKK